MPAQAAESRTQISAWTPRFARVGDSLWSIVHKFAAVNGFRGPRTREILRIGTGFSDCTAPQNVDSADFAILRLGEEAVSAAIAMSYVPHLVEREFGVANVFNKKLRFCSSCIEVGYHSAMHQFKYVQRCPIHDLPLVSACPKCGSEIAMSCSDIALKYAYSCRCGHSLLANAAQGSLAVVSKELDTTLVVSWLEWCRSWSEDLIYRELSSTCEVAPFFFGDPVVFAALNSLWAIRPPVGWQSRWVAFENAEGSSETRLSRSRKYVGAKGSELIDPELEKDLQKCVRKVIRETENAVKQHHPNCEYTHATECPAAEAFFSWAKHWAPSANTTVAAQIEHQGRVLGSASVYARIAWLTDTWEGDRDRLLPLSASLAGHLLKLIMLGSFGRELALASGATYGKRGAIRIGSVNDGSIRLILDVENRTLMIWEPPAIRNIKRNLKMLFRNYCDD